MFFLFRLFFCFTDRGYHFFTFKTHKCVNDLHKTYTVNNQIVNDNYYMPNSDPTKIDVSIARETWYDILSQSAAGYNIARNLGKIDDTITPIMFFYETFFNVWRSKNEGVLNDIYRNNIKIKLSSMIAMISFMLNSVTATEEMWVDIVKKHKNMGVFQTHYYLMGDVLIKTIMIVTNETNPENRKILAWRRIISHAIDCVILATRKISIANSWQNRLLQNISISSNGSRVSTPPSRTVRV